MAPPLVFVDDLHAPAISAVDRHHLERSLRMRAGDELILGDGRGGRRPARLGDVVEPTGPIDVLSRPQPALTVVFAPVKGERPEWMVAKLTELGVDRIVPMSTARSVVRWGADHDVARLVRVAREAAMQSRQRWLPTVEAPMTFTQATGLVGACLADPDGGPISLTYPVVLVGPEGGWSQDERSVELPRVRLAASVLRAETAAVVAGALLGALRDGVVHRA